MGKIQPNRELSEQEIGKLSEPGRQFYKIWEDFHNPLKRESARIEDNRDKRANRMARDTGIK